ncbi:hypothetical protein RU639_003863 [Aspergillus parasiticus]
MPRVAKKASAWAPLDAADPNGLVSIPQPPSSTSHILDVRPGDENTNPIVLSPGKSTQPTVSTAGTKRKADASEPEEIEEIDDEDPRLDILKWNCTQIRRKIKTSLSRRR